jgi:hypothetical protein
MSDTMTGSAVEPSKPRLRGEISAWEKEYQEAVDAPCRELIVDMRIPARQEHADVLDATTGS